MIITYQSTLPSIYPRAHMLPYVPTHSAHMGKHAHMFIHTHTHIHTPELLLVQCRGPPFDSGLFSQHLNAPPEVGIALGDLLLKNLDLQRGRDPATEVCECITDRTFTYRTLAKVRPWALHLTFSPNRGVGALSSVSAFNLERAPTFTQVAQ